MAEEVYKGTKYPKDITIKREKTLVFTANFFLATAEKGNRPIDVYDEFSRFAVSIINENKKTVTANIPVIEIENIDRMTAIAQMIDTQAAVNPVPVAQPPASASGNSGTEAMMATANGVRIANGTLKGKTPVEVLTGDPNGGVKSLLSQREWLKKNLEKYPGNQKQIDAIEAALTLYKAGQLAGAAAASPIQGREIVLYNAEYRPLVRKMRKDKKCPVYHITIKWCVGQDYPVSVKLINYYAPVKQNEQGLYNVKASQAEDRMETEMCLTASEWNNKMLKKIKTAMLQFEIFHARDCILDANDAEKRNIAAALEENA